MESGVVLNNQTHESNYSKLGASYNKWKSCKLSICTKAHERKKKPSRIHLKIYDEKLENGEQMKKKHSWTASANIARCNDRDASETNRSRICQKLVINFHLMTHLRPNNTPFFYLFDTPPLFFRPFVSFFCSPTYRAVQHGKESRR